MARYIARDYILQLQKSIKIALKQPILRDAVFFELGFGVKRKML